MSTRLTVERERNVKQFIAAIVDAALYDATHEIPEYHPTNTGERLSSRLNLSQFRVSPRRGDTKYARSLYTAVHWLYRTEEQHDQTK